MWDAQEKWAPGAEIQRCDASRDERMKVTAAGDNPLHLHWRRTQTDSTLREENFINDNTKNNKNNVLNATSDWSILCICLILF